MAGVFAAPDQIGVSFGGPAQPEKSGDLPGIGEQLENSLCIPREGLLLVVPGVGLGRDGGVQNVEPLLDVDGQGMASRCGFGFGSGRGLGI